MKKILLSAITVILSFSWVNANAIPIFNSTGLTSPATTITFDEHLLPTNSIVTTEYSDLGVTFSPNLYYSAQTGFPNITGNTITNFSFNSDSLVPDFSINFLVDQTESAFAMVSNGTTWDFSAYLDNVLVESFSQIVNTSIPNFYGFSEITFDEIRVFSSVNDAMIIDNLQMGTAASVPEPSLLALFGIGLVGVFFSRRKTNI